MFLYSWSDIQRHAYGIFCGLRVPPASQWAGNADADICVSTRYSHQTESGRELTSTRGGRAEAKQTQSRCFVANVDVHLGVALGKDWRRRSIEWRDVHGVHRLKFTPAEQVVVSSMDGVDDAEMVEAVACSNEEPVQLPIVSDESLQACVSVLEAFHSEDGLKAFKQPRYKRLRKALIPLMDDLRGKFFFGKTPEEDAQRQEKKRRLKVEKQRQRALDEQFINNTKLRAERIAKLSELTKSNPLLAQVPDGPSTTDPLLLKDTADMSATATCEEQDGEVENDDVQTRKLCGHRSCYTCKKRFRTLHHFYDSLCPECAALNFRKRIQTADLREHIAVVTGARVKIGYEIALKLLRSGAYVIATTRFPKDAAFRYAKEKDFDEWKDRLEIYGMDFRDLGVIERFMDHIDRKFGKLDIVINNATQTIRRPTHYYKHLIESEQAPVPNDANPDIAQILRGNTKLVREVGPPTAALEHERKETEMIDQQLQSKPAPSSISSVELSQVPVLPEDQSSTNTSQLFPQGQYDQNNQQIDLRKTNSWRLKINQVETMELVEVFAINAMAPFILNKRAIPLLEKSHQTRRFIINVSAMEGKFYRAKSPNHPHTNMAKAAVNMMTRTCAEDLATRGIYMNSVDTGWINDENPRDIAVRIAKIHNFQTPLDEIDAAARVLDPIFALHQEDKDTVEPVFGQFLKDYAITEW